jgi:RES domain-containing protein
VTKTLWRIAAVTRTYTADDLSGTGAKNTGGRWNSVGTPMVYCSESIALALLETIVHLRSGGLPLNRYLLRIDVPDDIWAARQTIEPPPDGWDAQPYGRASVQAGDRWQNAKSSALLSVPSVIVPDERNILINPQHPAAVRITATTLRQWQYDRRFF